MKAFGRGRGGKQVRDSSPGIGQGRHDNIGEVTSTLRLPQEETPLIDLLPTQLETQGESTPAPTPPSAPPKPSSVCLFSCILHHIVKLLNYVNFFHVHDNFL